MLNNIFINKKVNTDRLIEYGFEKQGDCCVYNAGIAENQLEVTVTVSDSGDVDEKVIDKSSGGEYVLHRTAAVGSFVGTVRTEVEALLTDIADKCFEPDVFKSAQAKEIIEFVRSKYSDELEFLWHKFPDNAVWRRKDSQKWYAVLLTVAAQKLGIDKDGAIEIIDFRMEPEVLENTVDNKLYYPGYHMNKKHWITIALDYSVPTDEICRRIDNSYALAK